MANSLRNPSEIILPEVRGRYSYDAKLGEVGWFRTGGHAEILFKPEDAQDLSDFLKNGSAEIPKTILGVLSNTIVRDNGVEGVVIRLGRQFASVERKEENLIYAGAAALDVNVAETACELGISGLEFLCGVPGSIGGAVFMNAGAYGSELKDVMVYADFLDDKGQTHQLTSDDLNMAYRHSEVPEGWICIGALLKGQSGDIEKIRTHMNDIREKRAATQPIRSQTGGSTFKNPKPEDLAACGLPETTKAWQLVDRVGGRGLMIGGAQMSEQHANFMINIGGATASDLENLGDEIRKRVMEETGYELKWEIARIGKRISKKIIS